MLLQNNGLFAHGRCLPCDVTRVMSLSIELLNWKSVMASACPCFLIAAAFRKHVDGEVTVAEVAIEG